MSKFLYFSCFLLVFSLMLGLFCTAFMLKWNDCMVILNRVTARHLPHGPLFGFLFTAPFLLFACMICINFVIACWLYCFNVDVFALFLFSVKSSPELMFLIVFITCWIEIKFYLLTYLLKLPIIINTVMWGLAFYSNLDNACMTSSLTKIGALEVWSH